MPGLSVSTAQIILRTSVVPTHKKVQNEEHIFETPTLHIAGNYGSGHRLLLRRRFALKTPLCFLYIGS